MRCVRLTIAFVAIGILPLRAQEIHGAAITGTVRDSASQPIADADVVMRPGNHRARSDSAGRFLLAGVDDGSYVVYARKLGYALERWDVKLSNAGRVDVRFVLHRQQQLEEVTVTAARNCPAFSLDGFACRRHAGGGIFLDYPDIDERGEPYTGNLFRDMPGFRTRLVSTRRGVVPVGFRTNGGCVNSLVDGRPASNDNPVPAYTHDLSAMEVYVRPDSVPPQYQRYTWLTGDIERTGRCSLVVYWTIWAPVTP